MATNAYTICVLAGDGIGPEVVGCARRVLDRLAGGADAPSFAYDEHAVGADAHDETGESFPPSALEAAKAADAVLVGAMDVARLPVHAVQPLRTLRQEFAVNASVRPARTFPGLPTPHGEIDTVVVREVTEGVYSGIEYLAGPDAACAVRLITRGASTRAAEVAFAQAAARRGKVTAVHKLGALKLTDTLFLDCAREVAGRYPDVELETRNVDACALDMIRHPAWFDVILATNAFGDILSDVAVGLAGGLGLAPSACVGARWAYFEPVHGAAPDIAGQGIANPLATILTAALMLRHLGEAGAAERIETAVGAVLEAGDTLSPDLGGTASSGEVTDAVIAALGS